MKIDYRSIHDIKPYENNPRKNDITVNKVIESIKKYGFRNPILIDENDVIISGHTRFKASIQLGMTNVPCIKITDLTDAQKKGFRIIDNKTQEYSDWDIDLLKFELKDITDDLGDMFESFHLDDLFFDEKNSFNPNLYPQFSENKITEEDINKKNDELINKFQNNQNLKTIVCPHCEGEITFEL